MIHKADCVSGCFRCLTVLQARRSLKVLGSSKALASSKALVFQRMGLD